MTQIISHAGIGLFIYSTKWFAIKKGYTANYTAWKNGLLIGFVITFITDGYLPVIIPGLITFETIKHLRYGKLFAGENTYDMFKMIAVGVLSLALLSILSHMIYFATHINFFAHIMVAAALIMFYAVLPLTKNPGALLFATNRKWFFLIVFFSFFFVIFTMLKLFFAVAMAFITAAVVWFILNKWLKKHFLIHKS